MGEHMKIKMIICDLDNTLLRMDGHFSEYTLDIWEKCRKMGIVLGFATARPKMAALRFVECAKPDVIITDGGALAKVGEEIIFRAIMPKETANEIIRILMSSDKAGYITASTDQGHLTNYPVDPEDAGWADFAPVYNDFLSKIDCDIYKITPEILGDEVVEEITALPDIAYTPFAGQRWGTFALASVTKWQAIQKVAEHLNIDTKHIAAFGDDFSDIEMLKGCGTGVAVGNAIEEVKAAADHICDTNDNDGVAKWLEEKILCK
jgi:Cof subfamily protein (haloacid dehalogenase superfamily)